MPILRWLLVAVVLSALLSSALGEQSVYPDVTPGHPLGFPRDFGAHPDFRTEWWYVTGWLRTAEGEQQGFQVTFFRSRPNVDIANPSAFAPRQIVFAHVALSDPTVGHLLHDQRVARVGFGLAGAEEGDTKVWIDDWRFTRDGGVAPGSARRYSVDVMAREFALRLTLTPTEPLLLQGVAGYSRKGPRPTDASHYYSEPQLAVTGTVKRDGRQTSVQGTAWLDHEWSTAYLTSGAVGWDWTGINLDDGGALMLFRMRDKSGRPLWAGGTWRRADGSVSTLAADAIAFKPLRRWQSPRTQAMYPVAMHIEAGDLQLDLLPLMDDQELDSRGSTGAVYWEGAVEAKRNGQTVGRGYLELTGYLQPLKL